MNEEKAAVKLKNEEIAAELLMIEETAAAKMRLAALGVFAGATCGGTAGRRIPETASADGTAGATCGSIAGRRIPETSRGWTTGAPNKDGRSESEVGRPDLACHGVFAGATCGGNAGRRIPEAASAEGDAGAT